MEGNAEKYVAKPVCSKYKPNSKALGKQLSVLGEMLMDSLGVKMYNEKVREFDLKKALQGEDIIPRVHALQKIVLGPEAKLSEPGDCMAAVKELRTRITDMLAERIVREKINKELDNRIREQEEQYIKELKLSVLKKYSGPESPTTLKKYAHLEKLEQKSLGVSMTEVLRPASAHEIIGQQRAIKALFAKVGSPYPQHVLLYGPPGVGKTSAARFALKMAKAKEFSPFTEDSSFIEVDGTTLRWDFRGIADPLLGSIHDPIYQGSNRELAETGIPEPKLGLVTQAHGGILFIDEIGEMDPALQNKLLKVLEDKRINFDSIYYDASNKHIPLYVRKLFEDGAPADFILIGATTRQPESINPAFRSRCTEVFFDPLTPSDIVTIINNAVNKLGVQMERGCARIISQYTIEGRKAVNILADAYNIAISNTGCAPREAYISRNDIYTVIQNSRLAPCVRFTGKIHPRIGRVLALGVAGYIGSILEIESIAFPALKRGEGTIRVNDTAGSMTKDSVFNAAAVIRKISGKNLNDYDVHINCIGGGRVDGPSAGIAILAALASSISQRPVRQDIAVTGEISIQGEIEPVGGIIEKIYGAKQNDMSAIIIPAKNSKEVPADLSGIRVYPVQRAEEVFEILFSQ